MTLRLLSSNRVEVLQAHLSAHLSDPLPDPFAHETVIVPGRAMARWINIQLAHSLGVAANIEYPLAASWIWELACRLLPEVPEHDPLARERSTWILYQRLPPLLPEAEFAPLRHYLSDDRDGVRRWQLAVRIADVFDRYQFYRPDWIRDWSAGPGAGAGSEEVPAWQPVLWRELVRDLDGNHRVPLIDRLLETLRSEPSASMLPRRVSAFALSSLPPLFIEVLQAVARHREVLLFQHSPTDQYWADLRSKKQRARLRINDPHTAEYYDTGNDLLVSWGRQGQAFQDLLLDSGALETEPEEDYREHASDSLLHRLQQSIFRLEEQRQQVSVDGSLQVSVCHSPLRECQVLHDQILREMQRDPGLKPEDILVMVPEISRYAPYIEAVFRRDETDSRPFIPWNLSDITLADEHPLIRVFFQLLGLPESRFGFSEIMSLLEVPEIAARFSLGQNDCDELHEYLRDSEIRWGLDADHKRSMDLPAVEQNTWRQGLDRLLAGYALGEACAGQDGGGEPGLWQDVAPVAVSETARAAALGRFMRFLDRLRHWCAVLDSPGSGQQWQQRINAMLEDFFQPGTDDDDRLQQIREVLDTLGRQAPEQNISLPLLRLWLEDSLGSQRQHGRYFSGGVTFCGMRPMRSLPFRVIVVMGMNDEAFPRRETPVEFDAMARRWQAGDPRKGDEDRYLLLETLLCARDKLYFSYTGRSLRDNEPRQPSVLLRELLDFLDAGYCVDDGGERPLSERLTTVHNMQPFSPRNYTADEWTQQSHDRFWCQVARKLEERARVPESGPWPAEVLSLPEGQPSHVTLTQMRRFLRHPVEQFFRQRLRIHLTGTDEYEDEEWFELRGIQGWRVRDRLLQDWLREEPASVPRLSAEGMLPHGAMAEAAHEDAWRAVQPLMADLAGFRGRDFETRNVRLAMPDGWTLEGPVRGWLPGSGLLHVKSSKYRGGTLLDIWLEHLALCAAGIPRPEERSLLYTRDRALSFDVLGQQAALEELQICMELYRSGLQRPLPVAPNASFVLAEKLQAGKDPEKAVENAWYGNPFSPGTADCQDPYMALLLESGVEPPLEQEAFFHLAQQLYARALHEGQPL